jgi:hypothetical protein
VSASKRARKATQVLLPDCREQLSSTMPARDLNNCCCHGYVAILSCSSNRSTWRSLGRNLAMGVALARGRGPPGAHPGPGGHALVALPFRMESGPSAGGRWQVHEKIITNRPPVFLMLGKEVGKCFGAGTRETSLLVFSGLRASAYWVAHSDRCTQSAPRPVGHGAARSKSRKARSATV